MRLEYEEPDRHRTVRPLEFLVLTAEQLRQRYEVAQALAHLLAVDGYHIVVHPVMHALCPAAGNVLRNLALVMREHQVHSSSVYVKYFSEVFFSHYRALEMPSGETFSPR